MTGSRTKHLSIISIYCIYQTMQYAEIISSGGKKLLRVAAIIYIRKFTITAFK